MKLSHINQVLENLLGRADIKEALSPGSAIRLLPAEKELSRLAHLSTKLCELRRKSCKCGAKSAKRKEPIKYGLNIDAITAQQKTRRPKGFMELERKDIS